METERRIGRARLRQRIAGEVIDWCGRVATSSALELHDLHARHARELGNHPMAELAERRYDRELGRHLPE
jgi:hypothetical protein